MNIKLIKSFFKDHMIDSMAYFGACFLIGLFYTIDTGDRIEIGYPLSLVLFVYLIWMIIRFVGYFKIYNDLEEMGKNQDFAGNYSSILNAKITVTFNKLHKEYLDKLSSADNTRKKERRFLSLWIHNMKTPITVTDLLLQRIEQKEIDLSSGMLNMAEENKKLLAQLDHVLNMIRLEDFAKDYVPEQIDLMEELKSIINKNKSIFIYNRVFPKIITELREAHILSDRKWNDLMINQIISNAVKYSKDEQGAPKDIYFYIEKEADRIILTIKDEGIGIPEHDLTKVFEPFFTGENGRKGYHSSGIGLYFCQEVSKLLGHSIQLTSKEGQGTSVVITYLAKL